MDLAINSITMNLLYANAPLKLVVLGWVVVLPWLALSLLAGGAGALRLVSV